MSWYIQDNSTSRGNLEKWEDRNIETVRNEDLPTEEVTTKREDDPTMPPSKGSRSCEESDEASCTDFKSKRDKWRSYHEQSPDTPTIAKVKGRPRGVRASFWQNKIETVGDATQIASSARRLQEMQEEIRRSRKRWSASPNFNAEVGDTEEETPTIEKVNGRPRGAKASFWENKICDMETELETVDHRRELAHRQKMEEEILRFRKPWREVMRAVGDTEQVAQTSSQQLPEEPNTSDSSSSDDEKALNEFSSSSSSSDDEKALNEFSSSDEEYYAMIDEQKRQAKLIRELSIDEMDEIVAADLENLDITEYSKKIDDSKNSDQEQALRDSSSDEEYYAMIDEQKRQAKLIRELSIDEMDEIVAADLENLDITEYSKKIDDSKNSDQEQALRDSSSDEEYYAMIDEQKRQAKLIRELSIDEMDEIVATDLENLDITEYSRKPDDSTKSDQFNAEKGKNTQSRAAAATERKSAPEKSAEIAEQMTPAGVPHATEKRSAAEQYLETAEQNGTAEVSQAIEQQSAHEQYLDIDKENAPVEVSQATEKQSAPEPIANINEQKVTTELFQAIEKKSASEQASETVEQKASVEVFQVVEEKFAPERIADTEEQKSPPAFPKDELSPPEESAYIDEEETPDEVPQAMEERFTLEEFADIDKPKTTAEVTQAMENNSSSWSTFVGTMENNSSSKSTFIDAHMSTSEASEVVSAESTTREGDDIVRLIIAVAQSDARSSKSDHNAGVKDGENVLSVSKCFEVRTVNFAKPKSGPMQTGIVGTIADGNCDKGDEKIAERVNCADEEDEAYGHPAESSTQEDDGIVELDTVVAQSDVQNSDQNAKVEYEETGIGGVKGNEQDCTIQGERPNEGTAHLESMVQEHRYTQPDELTQLEETEVFYDAVSDNKETDISNQEVDLEQKFLAFLAKTQQQENNQNKQVTEVSVWKRYLKKVGLAAIVTFCAVGGLYLFTQADDDSLKWLWNTASKILPFIEPIPEPEPEKSFLWKLLEALMPPTPPPPEQEKSFLLELFNNLPSLPFLR